MNEEHITLPQIINRSDNAMLSFINNTFSSVSKLNFDWISSWADKNGMEQKEIFENVSEKFREGYFKKNPNTYYHNSDFLQVLNNLNNHFSKNKKEFDSEKFFIQLGKETGSGFLDDLKLSYFYPLLTNRDLLETALYSGAYAAKTTHQRNVNVSAERIDDKKIKVITKVNPLEGVNTTIEAAAYYYGRVIRVLNSTIKGAYERDFEFNPVDGSFKISAIGENNESQNKLNWENHFKELPKIKRILLGELGRAKAESTLRKTIIGNISSELRTIKEKDLQQLYDSDKTTYYHNLTVGDLTLFVSKLLNFPKDEIRAIAYGGNKHDLGKVAIPEVILRSPERLKPEAYRIIQEHTRFGFIRDLEYMGGKLEDMFTKEKKQKLDIYFGHEYSKVLKNNLEKIILNGALLMNEHQMFFNGKGYPGKKQGEDISLAGRLIGIIDFYDAYSRTRSYKGENTYADTRKELIKETENGHFDPVLFYEGVLPILDELNRIGITHNSYPSDNKHESHLNQKSTLDNKISAYVRENISEPPINVSLKSDIFDYIKSQKRREVNWDDAINTTIKEFTGFFDVVKFNEMARKTLENPDSGCNIKELVHKTKEGRIFDLSHISREEYLIFRQEYQRMGLGSQSLISEEYIRHLQEKMPKSLLNVSYSPFDNFRN